MSAPRAAFVEDLLAWYATAGRDLPWRRTRDPYAILVSEVMLQQTQVARVVEAWPAFLDRFPTVRSLAAATVADVVSAWAGLGYNRRAVALHRAAGEIVERHDGAVPDDLDALRALPGVGEYTAKAVLAFAFGYDAAPVDTNVARVLLRGVAGAPLPPARLRALAAEVLPTGRARDWSQALMDLGAGTCVPRAPRCDACPVAGACAWRGARGDEDPAAGRRRPAAQPFEQTDRYHRGRLVDALRAGPVPFTALPEAARLGDDRERLGRLVDALVADGLAAWDGDRLRLPGAR